MNVQKLALVFKVRKNCFSKFIEIDTFAFEIDNIKIPKMHIDL